MSDDRRAAAIYAGEIDRLTAQVAHLTNVCTAMVDTVMKSTLQVTELSANFRRMSQEGVPPMVSPPSYIYPCSKVVNAPYWRALRDGLKLPVHGSWLDFVERYDDTGALDLDCMDDLWGDCLREASECHVMLAFRRSGEELKGALVEIGAALSHGRLVVLCGDWPEDHSYRHHSNVEQFDSLVEGTVYAASVVRPVADLKELNRAVTSCLVEVKL